MEESMSDPDKLDFPKNKAEAEQRFEEFGSKDPFPDIPPALLNSADIYDYARVTGMVDPFDPDPHKGKLKSASYEVDFVGDLHIANNETEKYEVLKVEVGVSYILPMNSISFLFTRDVFRLPDYMAARFNLRIKLVHAGLLLGTGPLIDPGFAGRLLIPLHNLTSEDFEIKGGEGLIWVEFTKLSPIKRPAGYRKGKYCPFPHGHRNADAITYLKKASRTGLAVPAASSIPKAILTAKTDAKQAKESADNASKSARDASEEAKKISDRFRNWGIFGIAALLVSLGSLFVSVLNLIGATTRELRDKVELVSISAKNLEGRIIQAEEAEKSLKLVHDGVEELRSELKRNNMSFLEIENRLKQLEDIQKKSAAPVYDLRQKSVSMKP
jgi:deoxycytidine triphosphate deaminase